MELKQNDLEHIIDQVRIGKMTAEEGNVKMVLDRRVYIVMGKIPRDIRDQYSRAVKKGILGHRRKDGNKPEAYYNMTFEYLVNGEVNKVERARLSAVRSVCI